MIKPYGSLFLYACRYTDSCHPICPSRYFFFHCTCLSDPQTQTAHRTGYQKARCFSQLAPCPLRVALALSSLWTIRSRPKTLCLLMASLVTCLAGLRAHNLSWSTPSLLSGTLLCVTPQDNEKSRVPAAVMASKKYPPVRTSCKTILRAITLTTAWFTYIRHRQGKEK